jgi:hypothetical protein
MDAYDDRELLVALLPLSAVDVDDTAGEPISILARDNAAIGFALVRGAPYTDPFCSTI